MRRPARTRRGPVTLRVRWSRRSGRATPRQRRGARAVASRGGRAGRPHGAVSEAGVAGARLWAGVPRAGRSLAGGRHAVRPRRASRPDRRNGRRVRHPPRVAGRGPAPPGGREHCGFGQARTAQGTAQVLLPFAWSDVALQATGASELRVRMVLLEAIDRRCRQRDARPVRREPAAGRKGRRAPPAAGDGRAGAAGVAVGGSRSVPHRLASRDPRRWSGAELAVGGVGRPGVWRRRSGSRLTRRCRRYGRRSMAERRSRSG